MSDCAHGGHVICDLELETKCRHSCMRNIRVFDVSVKI